MGIPKIQERWLDLQEKYRSGNIKTHTNKTEYRILQEQLVYEKIG